MRARVLALALLATGCSSFYTAPGREVLRLRRLVDVPEVTLQAREGSVVVDSDTTIGIELFEGDGVVLRPTELGFGRDRLRLGSSARAPVVPYSNIRALHVRDGDPWVAPIMLGTAAGLATIVGFAAFFASNPD